MSDKYNSHCYHGSVDLSGDVYYKLYKSSRSELFTVVCMQWFDEMDYYAERFVRNSSDEIHVFEKEQDAIDKLNEWFKPEQIDSEYSRDLKDIVRD